MVDATHSGQAPGSGGTLVIQPLPGIGDMVWHLPLIYSIATESPDGRVSILTKKRSRADELFAGNPIVRQVLWIERNPGPHDGLIGFARLVNLLQQGKYSHVWILHGSARYAWAACLAGIPLRTGYGRGMQGCLLSDPVQLPKEAQREHPILRAQRLLDLKKLPHVHDEPELSVSEQALATITARFEQRRKPWLALGIGSSEAYKQWGAENFACLARRLIDAGRIGSIFLLGGATESDIAQDILNGLRRENPSVVTMLSLPIDQAAALLSLCEACIANDTGVLNLAAAVGITSIGLFGASPELTHSRRIHAVLPDDSGLKMQGISVDTVIARVATLGHS